MYLASFVVIGKIIAVHVHHTHLAPHGWRVVYRFVRRARVWPPASGLRRSRLGGRKMTIAGPTSNDGDHVRWMALQFGMKTFQFVMVGRVWRCGGSRRVCPMAYPCGLVATLKSSSDWRPPLVGRWKRQCEKRRWKSEAGCSDQVRSCRRRTAGSRQSAFMLGGLASAVACRPCIRCARRALALGGSDALVCGARYRKKKRRPIFMERRIGSFGALISGRRPGGWVSSGSVPA